MPKKRQEPDFQVTMDFDDIAEANLERHVKVDQADVAKYKAKILLSARQRMLVRGILTALMPPKLEKAAKPSLPPLQGLGRLNDLVPSPRFRKKMQKLLSDQQAHIADLHSQGRFYAARWQSACTWCLWIWYVLLSPVSSLIKMFRPAT